MKIQAKQVLSFANDADLQAIAGHEKQGAENAMRAALHFAHVHRETLLNTEPDKAKRAVSGALAAQFKAYGTYTPASAAVTASHYAAVMLALAQGWEFENCTNLQACYRALPKAPRKVPEAAKTSAFKGAGAVEAELLPKLSVDQRRDYAERVFSATIKGLKDGTANNSALAAAVEYAMLHPAEVLQLAQAKQAITKARKVA